MTGAIAIGVAGGIVAGLLGVGGGVLFVPGLVIFLSLGQHQAEATSLLAIIPVAIVGTYRIATATCAAPTRCCWACSRWRGRRRRGAGQRAVGPCCATRSPC